MEFVLPFLSCKQRSNVAQTCSFLAQKNREFPIETLLLADRVPPEVLVRGRRISGQFQSGRHLFPHCHTISIHSTGPAEFVLPSATVAYINAESDFVWHVPRIETIWYQGPRLILVHLLRGVASLKSLDVFFTDPPVAIQLPRCLRFSCSELEGISVECSTLVVNPEERMVASFTGESLVLASGILERDIPRVPDVQIVSCSLRRLCLPRRLRSLSILQCNLIFSDLPVLPHVHHVDFSENHTLKDMPVCRGRLQSLNLLHTGIKNQIHIARAILGDTVDFLGLNVDLGDEQDLAVLFRDKHIRSAELCVAPYVKLPWLITERENVRFHTWSFFRKDFNHQYCRFFTR
jgi:hypothetical protein